MAITRTALRRMENECGVITEVSPGNFVMTFKQDIISGKAPAELLSAFVAEPITTGEKLNLVVDGTELKHISAEPLTAFLVANRDARHTNKKIVLAAMNEANSSALRATAGDDKYYDFQPTVEDALTSVQGRGQAA